MIGPVPTRDPIIDYIPRSWVEWFREVFLSCLSVQDSGTTAQRPVADLWNGRRYFDTTLGIPIWYFNGSWVDATGSSV